MKKQPKYFVTPDLGEFAVIYERKDVFAGNVYYTQASGFTTEAAAQAYADNLNKNEAV